MISKKIKKILPCGGDLKIVEPLGRGGSDMTKKTI